MSARPSLREYSSPQSLFNTSPYAASPQRSPYKNSPYTASPLNTPIQRSRPRPTESAYAGIPPSIMNNIREHHERVGTASRLGSKSGSALRSISGPLPLSTCGNVKGLKSTKVNKGVQESFRLSSTKSRMSKPRFNDIQENDPYFDSQNSIPDLGESEMYEDRQQNMMQELPSEQYGYVESQEEPETPQTVQRKKQDASKYITMLTDETFSPFLAQNPKTITAWTRPGCGHCVVMAPNYLKAARQMKKIDPSIRFTAVDGNAQQTLVKRNNIDGYPTVRAYDRTQSEYPKGYQGHPYGEYVADGEPQDFRTPKDFVRFAQQGANGNQYQEQELNQPEQQIEEGEDVGYPYDEDFM
ncbi:MAG: protein disulfide-isomerase A5-like [Sylvanvirus sp.]|uniref:Protein disulfide-isomerase A5-like n=1 Tax=Sylvanvirus sp. TaxID=2487774 RepID=A0A3G5AGX9_9VIRU|nr:MAG: protein disulfide-isomerase A5-like [Sylvanvirus sp.]